VVASALWSTHDQYNLHRLIYEFVFLEELVKQLGGLGRSFFFPTGVSGFIDQIERISNVQPWLFSNLKLQLQS
jgi:hypothetical protein